MFLVAHEKVPCCPHRVVNRLFRHEGLDYHHCNIETSANGEFCSTHSSVCSSCVGTNLVQLPRKYTQPSGSHRARLVERSHRSLRERSQCVPSTEVLIGSALCAEMASALEHCRSSLRQTSMSNGSLSFVVNKLVSPSKRISGFRRQLPILFPVVHQN